MIVGKQARDYDEKNQRSFLKALIVVTWGRSWTKWERILRKLIIWWHFNSWIYFARAGLLPPKNVSILIKITSLVQNGCISCTEKYNISIYLQISLSSLFQICNGWQSRSLVSIFTWKVLVMLTQSSGSLQGHRHFIQNMSMHFFLDFSIGKPVSINCEFSTNSAGFLREVVNQTLRQGFV